MGLPQIWTIHSLERFIMKARHLLWQAVRQAPKFGNNLQTQNCSGISHEKFRFDQNVKRIKPPMVTFLCGQRMVKKAPPPIKYFFHESIILKEKMTRPHHFKKCDFAKGFPLQKCNFLKS